MIDHFNLPVRDLEKSEAFYRAILAPLGYPWLMRDGAAAGFGKGAWRFGLIACAAPAPPMHLAFEAATRAQVDQFHAAALRAGASSNGAPGVRAQYGASYYAAFVIDPDGHNIEAVCRRAARRH
jgi:catechol 2,3-dioxygenase-like lactoylglutathione lyase family enzyme